MRLLQGWNFVMWRASLSGFSQEILARIHGFLQIDSHSTILRESITYKRSHRKTRTRLADYCVADGRSPITALVRNCLLINWLNCFVVKNSLCHVFVSVEWMIRSSWQIAFPAWVHVATWILRESRQESGVDSLTPVEIPPLLLIGLYGDWSG